MDDTTVASTIRIEPMRQDVWGRMRDAVER